jgi:hypothetical protein
MKLGEQVVVQRPDAFALDFNVVLRTGELARNFHAAADFLLRVSKKEIAGSGAATISNLQPALAQRAKRVRFKRCDQTRLVKIRFRAEPAPKLSLLWD